MSNELQTKDPVLRDLERMSNRPFLNVLARFLRAAPSEEAIAKFAAQYPDKWATALKALGGLGGYSTERVQVDLDVNLDSLSDSELRAKLDATLAAMNYRARQAVPVLEAEVVEAEAVEVPAAEAEPAAAE